MAGDGIGPEILAEVRRVVEWFIAERHLAVELHEELFGISAWKAHGELMARRPGTRSSSCRTFANAGTVTVIAMVTNPESGGSSYFLN